MIKQLIKIDSYEQAVAAGVKLGFTVEDDKGNPRVVAKDRETGLNFTQSLVTNHQYPDPDADPPEDPETPPTMIPVPGIFLLIWYRDACHQNFLDKQALVEPEDGVTFMWNNIPVGEGDEAKTPEYPPITKAPKFSIA